MLTMDDALQFVTAVKREVEPGKYLEFLTVVLQSRRSVPIDNLLVLGGGVGVSSCMASRTGYFMEADSCQCCSWIAAPAWLAWWTA